MGVEYGRVRLPYNAAMHPILISPFSSQLREFPPLEFRSSQINR